MSSADRRAAAKVARGSDFYTDADEECLWCGKAEYAAEGVKPTSIISCECCCNAYIHLGCLALKTRTPCISTEDELGQLVWCCSEGCEDVLEKLSEETNAPAAPVPGSPPTVTFQVVKSDETDRGIKSAVSSALAIFRGCFGEMLQDGGRCMLTSVCMSRDESDLDDGIDATAFRLAIVRGDRGAVVSVAAFRVFGKAFCEVPFVATRDGYRKQGNCRTLMKALQAFLTKMGVRWLLLPSVPETYAFWIGRFGFERVSTREKNSLGERIILPGDGSILLKKRLCPDPPAPPAFSLPNGTGSFASLAAAPSRPEVDTQSGGAGGGGGGVGPLQAGAGVALLARAPLGPGLESTAAKARCAGGSSGGGCGQWGDVGARTKEVALAEESIGRSIAEALAKCAHEAGAKGRAENTHEMSERESARFLSIASPDYMVLSPENPAMSQAAVMAAPQGNKDLHTPSAPPPPPPPPLIVAASSLAAPAPATVVSSVVAAADSSNPGPQEGAAPANSPPGPPPLPVGVAPQPAAGAASLSLAASAAAVPMPAAPMQDGPSPAAQALDVEMGEAEMCAGSAPAADAAPTALAAATAAPAVGEAQAVPVA